MMDLLRTHYASELDAVEKEIKDIFVILKPFIDSESYKTKMAILFRTMENLNRDIAKRKEQKFQRDSMAFSIGKAYKWKKSEEGRSDKAEKEREQNTASNKPSKNKSSKSQPLVPEESITTPDETNMTQHLTVPQPQISPQYISNPDMTQLSIYSTDEDFQNLISVPKR